MKERMQLNLVTDNDILTALLRKSVSGDAKAAYHAAVIMQDKNHDEVVIQNQLRRAADGNCIEAIRWLAMLGCSKHLVTPNSVYGHITYYKDYGMAMHWVMKGVEMGDPLCGLMLAKCYQIGVGVVKDSDKAEELIEKAVTHLGFEEVFTLSRFFAFAVADNTASSPVSFKGSLAS